MQKKDTNLLKCAIFSCVWVLIAVAREPSAVKGEPKYTLRISIVCKFVNCWLTENKDSQTPVIFSVYKQ